jgi:hypothetical protein
MKTLTLLASTALLAACSAEAKGPDAKNPFHCGVALSVEYGIAKSNGFSSHMKDLTPLIQWYAQEARALPEASRTEAKSFELMRQFQEDSALAKGLGKACVSNAFDDPRFVAWLQG